MRPLSPTTKVELPNPLHPAPSACRDGQPTSLGRLFQSLMILLVKKYFLISNLILMIEKTSEDVEILLRMWSSLAVENLQPWCVFLHFHWCAGQLCGGSKPQFISHWANCSLYQNQTDPFSWATPHYHLGTVLLLGKHSLHDLQCSIPVHLSWDNQKRKIQTKKFS